MDDIYSIKPTETGRGWCVRYEHTHGPIEIKCFKHLSAAIRYGKWIARTSPSGVLTVRTSDGATESMTLRPVVKSEMPSGDATARTPPRSRFSAKSDRSV